LFFGGLDRRAVFSRAAIHESILGSFGRSAVRVAFGRSIRAGTAANTEIFMLLPIILSQIAFLRSIDKPRNVWLMLACGALSGVAIAFKQVAGRELAFIGRALSGFFAASERRWRNSSHSSLGRLRV